MPNAGMFVTLGIEADEGGFRAVLRVDGETFARSIWCATREEARELKQAMAANVDRRFPQCRLQRGPRS